jgi:hypothetical protein
MTLNFACRSAAGGATITDDSCVSGNATHLTDNRVMGGVVITTDSGVSDTATELADNRGGSCCVSMNATGVTDRIVFATTTAALTIVPKIVRAFNAIMPSLAAEGTYELVWTCIEIMWIRDVALGSVAVEMELFAERTDNVALGVERSLAGSTLYKVMRSVDRHRISCVVCRVFVDDNCSYSYSCSGSGWCDRDSASHIGQFGFDFLDELANLCLGHDLVSLCFDENGHFGLVFGLIC